MSIQALHIQEHSLTGAIIAFGRILKEKGFGVSTASILDALAGIRSVGIDNIQDFKTVLKTVFVRRHEEHHIFDKLFQEFWLDRLLAEEDAIASKQKDGPGDDYFNEKIFGNSKPIMAHSSELKQQFDYKKAVDNAKKNFSAMCKKLGVDLK